jgi:hypothetical protein
MTKDILTKYPNWRWKKERACFRQWMKAKIPTYYIMIEYNINGCRSAEIWALMQRVESRTITWIRTRIKSEIQAETEKVFHQGQFFEWISFSIYLELVS